ncbi:MAG: phosphotransferase [Candidatus Nanohaloarchaea archaeon]|nr:phosphotransferase [Candidatus Nanohaloarchaea archaeon]
MDWDNYTDTGMLNAAEDFHSCSHGAIKPTYMIDSDGGRILHTVSLGDESRLHITREVYDRLSDTAVPSPDVVHDAADQTVPYLVVEAVDGDNPETTYSDMPVDEKASFSYQAGHALGEAHRALRTESAGTLDGTGDGIEIRDADWDTLLTGHMRDKIDYLRETELDSALLDDAEQLVDTIEDELDAPDEPGIIHLDYRPGNLMWDDGDVTAVLDWDNARAGDQLYDYVNAETSFVENAPEKHQDNVRQSFRQGYEDAGQIVDEDRLYETYRYLSLLSKTKGLLYVNEEYSAGREQRAERFTEAFKEQQPQLMARYGIEEER